MTPETLRAIGQALFGAQWQAPLARALGLDRKTVQRWANGEYPIPQERRAELAALKAERIKLLRAL